MGDEPDNDEGAPLEALSRDECVELLLHESFVGRLGLVVDGRPLVLPVNFLFEDDSIVLCTAEGTKLNAMIGGSEVAFEIDDNQPLHRSGWSVLVRGHAAVVTDPDELSRLRRGPLRPWARGARANWVRIPLEEVSGRRIRG